jgi:hypothetical protein
VGVRFPWGNVFALRCGHLCDAAPLDYASGSRRSVLRHRRFRHGCPHFRSQAFACPERRRVERAVSPVSFGRSRLGAPLPTAFSASRMRTTLGPSRSSCCLHRIVSTSDILVVIRRHARPTSSSTDALTVTRSSRMVPLSLTFEPKDCRFTVPVRARWAKARECLPSSREPASRNPRTECTRTFNRLRTSAHCFAFSPPVPGVRPCFELPSG